MDVTLDLSPDMHELVELFALATNLGMFSSSASGAAAASVDLIDSHTIRLRITQSDPASLLSLRRMLISSGAALPPAFRSMPSIQERDLEADLSAETRALVSLSGLGELSGDAVFVSVRGASSVELYDVVRPVVGVWQRLLAKHGLPYRVDDEPFEDLSTEGIEVYESSEVDVEVATTGYGGGEEGIAALVNGLANQLALAGLAFQMRCWSG